MPICSSGTQCPLYSAASSFLFQGFKVLAQEHKYIQWSPDIQPHHQRSPFLCGQKMLSRTVLSPYLHCWGPNGVSTPYNYAAIGRLNNFPSDNISKVYSYRAPHFQLYFHALSSLTLSTLQFGRPLPCPSMAHVNCSKGTTSLSHFNLACSCH